MGWKDKAKQIIQSGAFTPVYHFFGGLSEFWAIVFGVACVILAFRGKLDGNFALTITAIQGLLCAHDALDDYHVRNAPQQTTVVNDITIQK
jgi:hypothetical protein